MKINKYLLIVLFLFNMARIVAQSFSLDDVDVKLNKVYDDDQQIRAKMMNAHMNNLPNVREIVAEMDSVDSDNQQYVSNLLDNYGWPDSLSEKASNAIWLVIDHANNQFSEKYFPLVKEKGEQGILQISDVATLEDRILMSNNKKQKYGTQTVGILYIGKAENIFYIWPIEDNEKVDDLRASVGLPPIDFYLLTFESKVIWTNSKKKYTELSKNISMVLHCGKQEKTKKQTTNLKTCFLVSKSVVYLFIVFF